MIRWSNLLRRGRAAVGLLVIGAIVVDVAKAETSVSVASEPPESAPIAGLDGDFGLPDWTGKRPPVNNGKAKVRACDCRTATGSGWFGLSNEVCRQEGTCLGDLATCGNYTFFGPGTPDISGTECDGYQAPDCTEKSPVTKLPVKGRWKCGGLIDEPKPATW